MDTYTFIMELKGGTYVSQRLSESVNKAAIEFFADDRYLSKDVLLSEKQIKELKEEFDDEFDSPVPLEGLRNVWCFSSLLENELVSINLVKTSID